MGRKSHLKKSRQEFPHSLWNQQTHYHVHKNLSSEHILSHIHKNHMLQPTTTTTTTIIIINNKKFFFFMG
jgi:hypothetical protein